MKFLILLPIILLSINLDAYSLSPTQEEDNVLRYVAASNHEANSDKHYREYSRSVTSAEKKDLSFIVNTMGMSSLPKIALKKSALKKAGKRVDHLHPLKFLLSIFSDEKMKASMHAMQERGWIFDEFVGGVKKGMEEESAKNNVKSEHINDFAKRLKIKEDLISPYIKQHQWKQLVLVLIKSIPRDPQMNRYDM